MYKIFNCATPCYTPFAKDMIRSPTIKVAVEKEIGNLVTALAGARTSLQGTLDSEAQDMEMYNMYMLLGEIQLSSGVDYLLHLLIVVNVFCRMQS